MIDITGALFYLTTAIISVAAFILGLVAGRASRQKSICGIAIALALILFKAVLHAKPVWEASLFPWVGYVYFQSYWLYPFGLFFFGMAIPHLSVIWNRLVIGLVAGCFFAFSLWSERWMVLPPDDSSTQTATADHHCRQTTMYTCVPASCVSLLSFWGIDATEGEMARLCRTRGDGTTTFNAFRGLKQKLRGTNLRTQIIEMNEQRFRNINVPVLFCQRGHAFVMVYDGQHVTVLDPLIRSATQVSIDHVLGDLFGATVVVLPPEDR